VLRLRKTVGDYYHAKDLEEGMVLGAALSDYVVASLAVASVVDGSVLVVDLLALGKETSWHCCIVGFLEIVGHSERRNSPKHFSWPHVS